jgi:hypothetical protein
MQPGGDDLRLVQSAELAALEFAPPSHGIEWAWVDIPSGGLLLAYAFVPFSAEKAPRRHAAARKLAAQRCAQVIRFVKGAIAAEKSPRFDSRTVQAIRELLEPAPAK